ncbi:MAG: hypothetical protein ACKOA9_09160 [Actinomycetota bacterium]
MTPTHRRRPVRRRALLVAVALVAAVPAVAGPVPHAGATGAPASSWDPRIADVVTEVERLRGLEFRHPVPVAVLGDAAFEKRFLGDDRPTRRDRKEWAQIQAAFIAMGLQEEPVGLGSVARASSSNVVGFYDPRRKTIVVRGSQFGDPGTRVTLAHELTHALQDQHFDLVALQKRGAKADSLFPKALVEGDATDVGQRYYAALRAEERAAADASDDAVQAEASALPPFLETVFYAPYALGIGSVGVLRALQGRAGLDAVMRNPPTRDLGLVDPTALLDPPAWVSVRAPRLRDGDIAQGDPFPLDAVGLYLVLAEHLDWTDALDVAERWGGDQTVAFTRAGRPCVTTRIAGRRGADDAGVIGDAFGRWAAAGGTETVVTRDADTVRITLCDPPDRRSAPAPAPPAQALVGLSIRNGLVEQALEAGKGLDAAKCTADRLVRLPETGALVGSVDSPTSDLDDDLTAAFQRAAGARFAALLRACAAGS